MSLYGAWDRWFMSLNSLHLRLGDEERRLMHLVPAPAVRLMTSYTINLMPNFIYEKFAMERLIGCTRERKHVTTQKYD